MESANSNVDNLPNLNLSSNPTDKVWPYQYRVRIIKLCIGGGRGRFWVNIVIFIKFLKLLIIC